MALKRISDLDPATLPLDGTELFEIEQAGASPQISVDDIIARAAATVARQCILLTVTAEDAAVAAGAGAITFRMPYAFTLTGVRASLTTAQATGSILTIDINEAGVSVLSTPITIDNTERTSTTAATPPVISDAALADDAEITIDVDQIGDGTAEGLKIYLIGVPA